MMPSLIIQELPVHTGHMKPDTILHQQEPRAQRTSVGSHSNVILDLTDLTQTIRDPPSNRSCSVISHAHHSDPECLTDT